VNERGGAQWNREGARNVKSVDGRKKFIEKKTHLKESEEKCFERFDPASSGNREKREQHNS